MVIPTSLEMALSLITEWHKVDGNTAADAISISFEGDPDPLSDPIRKAMDLIRSKLRSGELVMIARPGERFTGTEIECHDYIVERKKEYDQLVKEVLSRPDTEDYPD